jgi:hypothetical protein
MNEFIQGQLILSSFYDKTLAQAHLLSLSSWHRMIVTRCCDFRNAIAISFISSYRADFADQLMFSRYTQQNG